MSTAPVRFERKRAATRQESNRSPRSMRKALLWVLWLLPVLLIFGAFAFGVTLQTFALVPTAKQGGVLGGVGSVALTILIVSLLCIPGYFVAVVWWTWASRRERDDAAALKRSLRLLPVVALSMSWLPAVVVPNIDAGLRIQVGGVMVFLTLFFGVIWVVMVRLLLKLLVRVGWVNE